MIDAFRDGLARVRHAPALSWGSGCRRWRAGHRPRPRAPLAARGAPRLEPDGRFGGHRGELDWWNEFLAQASGLGQTFVPAILGFAAVLDNLSRLADHKPLPPVTAAVVGAQLLLAVFLAGGLLDRLARDRVVGARGVLLGLRCVGLAISPVGGDRRALLHVPVRDPPPLALRRAVGGVDAERLTRSDRRLRCTAFYAAFFRRAGVRRQRAVRLRQDSRRGRRPPQHARCAGRRHAVRWHPAKTMSLC